jgi:hypothetical protein
MKWKGWIVEIFGLWLLLAAFLRLGPTGYFLNDIIVGIVVFVTSLCIAWAEPREAWITVILGFWLIVAAFHPDLVSGIGLYLNNIIVGLIITATGLVILAHTKKLSNYGDDKHREFGDYGAE